MKWYNFIACFFLGVFFVNSIPHFIHGISGDYFPTPFANPPGKGLSSPLLNVIWGFINIIVCLLLYKASKITLANKWTILLFAIGFAAMSIRLSFALANKG
jgi:hypothetical protein